MKFVNKNKTAVPITFKFEFHYGDNYEVLEKVDEKAPLL